MLHNISIYTDGGARGNPGHAGAGYVIYVDDETAHRGSRYLGIRTNNQAEYEALIMGLSKCMDEYNTFEVVNIYMDSELIVKQMKGEYKVKNLDLKILNLKVHGLIANKNKIKFVHIPREKNRVADRLANMAMDKKSN